MGPLRRLAAHFTLTPGGLERNIVVTVDGRGRIAGLDRCSAPDRNHGVEFHSGILIPGLVNAHTHLELSHLKGVIPPGGGFSAFAAAMSASGRTPAGRQQRQQAASYRDALMWAEGVSAAGDISNTDITLEVKEHSRIVYHTFVEVFGLGTRSTQRFADILRLTKERGQAASLTPHSMYSLGQGLLEETLAGDDGILSVHFMESRGEAELFQGRGQLWRWYNAAGFREDFTGVYLSPAARLIRSVPADRKILLVHDTFVSGDEVDEINGHFGGNATWVVCPRSNRYIENAAPPVGLLREKGCRIAVGTDSMASNGSLSVIEELKALDAPLEEALRWATIEGARALGMEGRLGSLEHGKTPGVVLVEKADMDNMRLTAQSSTRRLV
ncbi:MAG: amidohydrolase family protein [Rikenellaceae bacterium]|nr:amidohydrolase family protein [Rikenellaceae bacterium]